MGDPDVIELRDSDEDEGDDRDDIDDFEEDTPPNVVSAKAVVNRVD